ncbi:hypothetical protein EJ04DRAFT_354410 [Polyplosphaeria fusca]|uniref:Uncharacterized protein n=1 Tax=Polyplosphaeria fusca TaxID=682080 RepID=A0A9P4R5H3_9PLEO|nr:hypothetical protein EJ04DRAFT_354410 [Polyplosphaeria fusca]
MAATVLLSHAGYAHALLHGLSHGMSRQTCSPDVSLPKTPGKRLTWPKSKQHPLTTQGSAFSRGSGCRQAYALSTCSGEILQDLNAFSSSIPFVPIPSSFAYARIPIRLALFLGRSASWSGCFSSLELQAG